MILLALFASVVIVTVPATNFFNEAMETIDLQNKLLTVEDVKPILDNYRQAQTRYSDVVQVQSLVRTNNESLSNFIDIFEQLRPSNISIQSFSCSEGQVSFSALAQGKKTVAKLIQQLGMIANVSEVKVSALSSVFEGNQETVAFSLTCTLINQDSILNPGTKEEALENMMPDEYSEIWAPDEGVEEDGTGGDDTDGAGTENEVLEKNNVQSADIEEGGLESGQTQLAAQVNAAAVAPAGEADAAAVPVTEQTPGGQVPDAPAANPGEANPGEVNPGEANSGEANSGTANPGAEIGGTGPEPAPVTVPDNTNADIPAGAAAEGSGPASAKGLESGGTAS